MNTLTDDEVRAIKRGGQDQEENLRGFCPRQRGKGQAHGHSGENREG